MAGEKSVVSNELKGAAIKTVGGAAVGGVSYVGALSVEDLQMFAAIFAAVMTGLYFSLVAFHTSLKILWDMQDRKAKRK